MPRYSSNQPDSSANFGLADFDHAADGICVCHAIEAFPHVRFLFWNRRMVDLTGYTMEEINRKGWYQSVYPDPHIQARALSRMAEMREGVNLDAEEWDITRADGEIRTLRISTSVIDRGDGPPRFMAIMHDVTITRQREKRFYKKHRALEREMAQQATSLIDADTARQITEARYRSIFENANDALFLENHQDQILEVNQKGCDLLGYTRKELLTMTVSDIQAPECRGRAGSVIRDEIDKHRGLPFEAVDLHKDGTRIPVEVTTTQLEEEGLVLSIVRDIRTRVAAEQARRETYDIIEKSQVAAFLWRNADDWPVEHVTRNVAGIFGYSDDDFLSGRIVYSAVVYAADLNRVGREVADATRDPDCMEFEHEPYRIVTKDGTLRWVSDHTFIRRDHTGAATHYQGIVEDITDRVAAEKSLQESEDKFSRAFHFSPDPVMITRLEDGRIIDVNESYIRASGYRREEIVGRSSIEDINLWVDPAERQDYLETLLKSGSVRNMELHFQDKQGNIRLGSCCGEILELNDETWILGTMRDITDEREAANQLAAEKERLGVTLRSIGDAVITTDADGLIALMNPVAEQLTGWPESEAIGQPLPDVFRIVNEYTRESCEDPVQKVLTTGQIVGLANHTMLIARDGREFIIADSGAPIRDAANHIVGVVLVFRDTTDRVRLEKELLKMEKLQSLGVLAGGIAHDFNNFLTGIIGNLSIAKLDIETSHPVTRSLNEMEKAAVRAKDLTQQLLTFSKGGDPVKNTVNFTNLVREATQFALRGSNVRCEFDFEGDLRPVRVDEGQIAQVLHNLMINADHAMPDGGTIRVKGANVSVSPDNPYALTPGDFIQLSVRDQGTGIKANHLKKVFDPYFSTKQKGSGLGLAVAYSIIAKHDGQLTVDSILGEGTTFTILLPASADAGADGTKTSPQLVLGQGHVLVMDDEDFIRELAQAMLAKLGYRVSLARDGQTAVKLYKKALDAGEPFDAVILDLTVPGGMGGEETLRQLSAMDPNLRAIVSSGYSNAPVMANYARYGFCGAVKKPYVIEELSQQLRSAIAG